MTDWRIGQVVSGGLIPLVLMYMAIEAGVIVRFHRPESGPSCFRALRRTAAQLVPGACLLLAVGSAAEQGATHRTLLWLTLSFPAHLWDLYERWGPPGRALPSGSLPQSTGERVPNRAGSKT